MSLQKIKEGKTEFYASIGNKPVSKELEVFYNSVMKFNRDSAVLVLKTSNQKYSRKNLKIADPLAGSGVRITRFENELPKNAILKYFVNDISKNAIKILKKNLKLNKIKNNKAFISNQDANLFLLNNKYFDYIDIDPFGSPVYFLDNAVQSLKNKGILAVTATDTAALSGSSPSACKRKYWSVPLKNDFMHETGLRILIRRVQLTGLSHEKILLPLLSFYKDHYVRIYFSCENANKKKINEIFSKNKELTYKEKNRNINYGPLWTGSIGNSEFIGNMIKSCDDAQMKKFLTILKNECEHNIIGFIDLTKFAKQNKFKKTPKKSDLLKTGKAIETHCNPNAVKWFGTEKELKKYYKN